MVDRKAEAGNRCASGAGEKNMEKISIFFKKTLSFWEDMVYNKKETWRRVRKAKAENTKERGVAPT